MNMTMDKFGIPEKVMLPRPDGNSSAHHTHLARIDQMLNNDLQPEGSTGIIGFVDRQARNLIECTVQDFPEKQYHRIILRLYDLTPNAEKTWIIEDTIDTGAAVDWATIVGMIQSRLPRLYGRIKDVPAGDPMPDAVLRQMAAQKEPSPADSESKPAVA